MGQTATLTDTETQTQPPVSAPAAATAEQPSSGFSIGGFISMIINALKGLLTGAGSLISAIFSGGSTPAAAATPPTDAQPSGQAATPPAQLADAQAQARAAMQNTTPTADTAGNPNSLPRQPDTGRQLAAAGR